MAQKGFFIDVSKCTGCRTCDGGILCGCLLLQALGGLLRSARHMLHAAKRGGEPVTLRQAIDACR